MRTLWIAFRWYRLLLVPLPFATLAVLDFVSIGRTPMRILQVLGVVWLIPAIAYSGHKGWKRLSAR